MKKTVIKTCISLVICLFTYLVGTTLLLNFAYTPNAWADDYEKLSLVGADFSGQDLHGSTFNKANLKNSNFSNANLTLTSMFGTNLQGANLQGANLTNATLDTARFNKADLTNAIFAGAFAYNAVFDGAIIDGTDFTDVLFGKGVVEKLCETASGTNPVTGKKTRETLMCE